MNPPTIGKPAIEALGIRLRDLRCDAAMTGRQLAAQCGWQPSKVSKIEYGRQRASEADIRDWCITCGFPSEIPDLIVALRSIDAQVVDWRRSLKAGTKRRQRANVSAYEKTTLFRVWESAVLPGLLQTPAYSRGVLTTVIDFYGIPDDLDEGVKARIAAQHVLSHGDRRFLIAVDETALYTLVGDAQIMRGQLEWLLEATRMPRVSLGVVPRGVPYTVPRNNAFTIYDNRLVTVATYTAELTLTQRHEVAIYERAFDCLQALALRGSAARDLIGAALAHFGEI
ncbi:MAG: helix-turn-helix domain-containing protein [Dactylosporangium sp.]|nr:helix-turn-helix domain-containing protein [Dactylosporangium sp.]NNJ61042.1 helix-turn-helix domain-containing protein [Dactylosporangium sp.]